ncbi:hypothetical protein CL65_gp104 [Mycobacterium phage Patience]|uniref:Uncharacterized protein n=2 Tax=Patiencevirus patience TaxID=1982360 RepID=A0A0K1LS24_9CAUD|nr:hypothetical protein CL65_gp104 [Mycobacterium phage Patience]AEL98002.1 hypothetical protein PATIENCE_94 [Mycobacterium phage Patience]AKU45381.1 hypothetical protein MADRUGA_92 [Mycobacterium phage Madruga]UOW93417.1 hypothetical protein SEA_LABELLE_93 [Mycobacterium phage Labelle]
MKLPSDPTEIKSVHVKTYVEPSVSSAIESFRKKHHHDSTSSAVRDLVIRALEEVERITSKT